MYVTLVLLSVKEQCVVVYPYQAINDDELSLAEGQIVTVVSRDVEDKGWWKGEVDGRTGVFPDNFVKLITTPTAMSQQQNNAEEVRDGELVRVWIL